MRGLLAIMLRGWAAIVASLARGLTWLAGPLTRHARWSLDRANALTREEHQ